jgi:UDPglucose 6-dehydrogenase
LDITVIGLGYVGTVAAANLAAAGHRVLGIDIDPSRIEHLRSGAVPFYEPGLEEMVQSAMALGRLRFDHRDAVDTPLGAVALVATGTPQAANGSADLDQVKSALAWIKSRRQSGAAVVMKSTVPPGTGQRIVENELRGTGLRYVANPEFLREGQAVEDWRNPDRIVIGADPHDAEAVARVKAMHAGIEAPHIITDITSAEMIKYASNAFLATRISFINEIALLCDRIGASIDAVSEGLAMDARAGARIYAGVGYGGSCFPKDVRALDYLALTSGVSVDLLRSVINVNNRQRMLPLYALRQRFNGALNGVRVGVLGLAFKPETDDVRDAPSLSLIRELVDEGVQVLAFDPQASETACRQLSAAVHMTDSPVEAAEQAQAVILLTEWPQIVRAEWSRIAAAMCPPRLLFDGRNALDADAMRALGFEYAGVGRKGLPIQ